MVTIDHCSPLLQPAAVAFPQHLQSWSLLTLAPASRGSFCSVPIVTEVYSVHLAWQIPLPSALSWMTEFTFLILCSKCIMLSSSCSGHQSVFLLPHTNFSSFGYMQKQTCWIMWPFCFRFLRNILVFSKILCQLQLSAKWLHSVPQWLRDLCAKAAYQVSSGFSADFCDVS